jgi:hypothetical protein
MQCNVLAYIVAQATYQALRNEAGKLHKAAEESTGPITDEKFEEFRKVCHLY